MNNISDIFVLGHSMAKGDFEYFKKLKEDFEGVPWHIFYYGDDDRKKKMQAVVDLGISGKCELLAL